MTDAIPAEQLDAAADGAFSGKLADPADTLTKRGGKGHVVYEGTAYDRLAWTRRCAERGYTLAAGEGALLLAALIEAEHNISALAAELATLTRERDALRNEWSGLLIEQANLLRLREEAIQQRDEARRDGAKRDEAIVAYGRSVILNAYATHVNEYRLTRPEYAETLMREVLANVDRYMERDQLRAELTQAKADDARTADAGTQP